MSTEASTPATPPYARPATPPRVRTLEEFLRDRFDLARAALTAEAAAACGGDADALHRMRVAVRRLRGDLRTFELLLETSRLDGLDAELRALGQVLGAVRDLDVIRPHLAELLTALPAAQAGAGTALLVFLDERRTTARLVLAAHLATGTHAALLERLAHLVADPPVRRARARDADAEPAVRRAVRRSVKGDARRARRLGARPAPDDLHALRKRLKRTRYGAQALAELSGRAADRRLAKGLGAVQDELGRLQDQRTLRDWLGAVPEEAPATTPASAAFAAGFVLATLGTSGAPSKRWRRARLRLRALAEAQR